MANRVVDADVRVLIPETSISDLTPFINTANLLVNRLAASACGSTLTDDELTAVELYLSAHYATVSDPTLGLTSEKVEGASAVASRGNVNSKSGLMSTQFGQQANDLSGGCLQEVSRRRPSVTFA